MSFFQAAVLGIVQGLTEFLPISSSGHLVLVPSLLGWEQQSLAFDTFLHMGTVSALIIYFFKDLIKIAKDLKLITLLIVGSIPAGILGFLFEDAFEQVFRSSSSVVIFLLAGSFLMFIAEWRYKKVWYNERIGEIEKISKKKSFLIGVFQSLALFPGFSRSGATISSGMLFGLTRENAARFSFLLSIPIIVGASVYKVLSSYSELSFDAVLFTGYLSSFLVGMAAISFLLKFLKNNDLYVFVIYRVLLAAVLIFVL